MRNEMMSRMIVRKGKVFIGYGPRQHNNIFLLIFFFFLNDNSIFVDICVSGEITGQIPVSLSLKLRKILILFFKKIKKKASENLQS